MPPQLALYGCYALSAWLLWKDVKWRHAGSKALWIPGIWIAIQGSRPLSRWLNPESGSDAEGNPINTVLYAVLILASVVVITNRRINWSAVLRKNKLIFLIYLYFALSAVWSDAPFISLKRLVKDFGFVLAALVLLSEKDPGLAIRAVFVRVAYLLLPLSLVLGKYFPYLGRDYTKSGEPMFTGVATQKNSLGEIVFVLGLMVLWDLLEILKEQRKPARQFQVGVRAGLLVLALMLLLTCHSQTSLLCLAMGCLVLWGCGFLVRMPRGKTVLVSCLIAGLCVAALDQTFGLSQILIKAMGRDPDLTGRTSIWRIVREQNTDPVLGSGFYVFWDSDKGKAVVDAFMQINSTHNGYLEMYVDGGLIADILLIALLLIAGNRIIKGLFMGHPLGGIGLAIWITAIVYNLSESSFFRLDALWFTLLLVMIEPPRKRLRPAPTAEQEIAIPASA